MGMQLQPTTATDINLDGLSLQDLRTLNDRVVRRIKSARANLAQDKKSQLTIGQTVSFISRGVSFEGDLVKINRTKCVVQVTAPSHKAGRYTVPMSMLD